MFQILQNLDRYLDIHLHHFLIWLANISLLCFFINTIHICSPPTYWNAAAKDWSSSMKLYPCHPSLFILLLLGHFLVWNTIYSCLFLMPRALWPYPISHSAISSNSAAGIPNDFLSQSPYFNCSTSQMTKSAPFIKKFPLWSLRKPDSESSQSLWLQDASTVLFLCTAPFSTWYFISLLDQLGRDVHWGIHTKAQLPHLWCCVGMFLWRGHLVHVQSWS